MNELFCGIVYYSGLAFIVGFMAYRPPQRGRYRDLNKEPL